MLVPVLKSPPQIVVEDLVRIRTLLLMGIGSIDDPVAHDLFHLLLWLRPPMSRKQRAKLVEASGRMGDETKNRISALSLIMYEAASMADHSSHLDFLKRSVKFKMTPEPYQLVQRNPLSIETAPDSSEVEVGATRVCYVSHEGMEGEHPVIEIARDVYRGDDLLFGHSITLDQSGFFHGDNLMERHAQSIMFKLLGHGRPLLIAACESLYPVWDRADVTWDVWVVGLVRSYREMYGMPNKITRPDNI